MLLMQLYTTIKSLLKQHNISHKEYDHEPILSYEDAEQQKGIHQREWVESKNVFLKSKKWEYLIFVTVQWEKVDFKFLKELTWEKYKLASDDDVKDVIMCVPGCVAPFGFGEDVLTVVDKKVYGYESYLFSPGVTTKTIQLDPSQLEVIFEGLGKVMFV